MKPYSVNITDTKNIPDFVDSIWISALAKTFED